MKEKMPEIFKKAKKICKTYLECFMGENMGGNGNFMCRYVRRDVTFND